MSRWACAKATVELAKAEPDLTAVNVFPCWPGDKWMTTEVIWGVDTDGEQSYANNSPEVEDNYTQRWAIRVGNAKSVAEAMERIDEIVAAFRKAISADACLDELRGDDWYVTETGGGQLSTNGVESDKGPIAVAVFDQSVQLIIRNQL